MLLLLLLLALLLDVKLVSDVFTVGLAWFDGMFGLIMKYEPTVNTPIELLPMDDGAVNIGCVPVVVVVFGLINNKLLGSFVEFLDC